MSVQKMSENLLQERNYMERLQLLREVVDECGVLGSMEFVNVALKLPTSRGGILSEDVEQILNEATEKKLRERE